MKKPLLLLGALVLAGLAVLGLFAAFAASQFRPVMVRELERALGKPVRLEGLSLGWRGGVALRLKGFTVFEDAAAQGEPLIEMEAASALVEFWPLLRKEARVSSVVLLRPRLHVSRDAQGRINLLGRAAAAAPPAASPGSSQEQAVGAAPPAGSAPREARGRSLPAGSRTRDRRGPGQGPPAGLVGRRRRRPEGDRV